MIMVHVFPRNSLTLMKYKSTALLNLLNYVKCTSGICKPKVTVQTYNTSKCFTLLDRLNNKILKSVLKIVTLKQHQPLTSSTSSRVK